MNDASRTLDPIFTVTPRAAESEARSGLEIWRRGERPVGPASRQAGVGVRGMLASLTIMALTIGTSADAWAHCDTLSGPVIAAARSALESGNVNLVLIWVQPGDEATIRGEFNRALAARAMGGPEQAAAEQGFFEALVRIHRAGEGAPYTGLKPAGTDVGPAVAAADKALAEGTVDPVRAALVNAVQSGIEKHYRAVADSRNYAPDDVAAGRAYVRAYVEYTHFAEGLYHKATAAAAHHEPAEEAHDAALHAREQAEEGHGAPQKAHACSQGAQGSGLPGHETAKAETDRASRSHGAGHLSWLVALGLGIGLLGESTWIVSQKRRGRSQGPSWKDERTTP